MKVYAVIVFDSGDMTTSVWDVFSTRENAEKYKQELLSDRELNSDGYYLKVNVSEHKVK